jgi:hypothetical protein
MYLWQNLALMLESFGKILFRYQALELILPKVSSIGTKFCERNQALELNFAKGIKHWN